MATAETIYELVKKLPDEQINLVLGFIQFLLKGEWILPATPETDSAGETSQQLPWPELVQSLSGAWADFPSLDDIRNEQGQDYPREMF